MESKKSLKLIKVQSELAGVTKPEEASTQEDVKLTTDPIACSDLKIGSYRFVKNSLDCFTYKVTPFTLS